RLDVGQAKAYRSIADLVADPAIDALWLCGPNFARIENVEEIADTVAGGKGELKGVACEKPLARNVAEAKRVTELVKKAGIATGYLENQLFAPAVIQGRAIIWARGAALTGRPYLARARERRGDRRHGCGRQGGTQGRRVREAPCAQRRRSETGHRARQEGRDRHWLPREPAVRAGRDPGPGHHLGTGRGAYGSPLPRPSSGTSRRSPTRLRAARGNSRASRARSPLRATSPKRNGSPSSSRRPGSPLATSRTSCSRRP